MPTQNLLMLFLLLMLMMRIVLATVSWRFGSWGLVIKLIFCSDFGFVWPPQTNFWFPSVGSFSRAHPSFWPFRASDLLVPLFLDRGQLNLVGPTGPSKKMSHNDNRPGPGQKYRQTSIFKFGRKALFGQKSIFFPTSTRNLQINLGKGYLFICTTLPGRGQNMVRVMK